MEAVTVAVIGGTGPQGRGLAFRLARAGHRVVIGSRSTERAGATARELGPLLPDGAGVSGAGNAAAAAAGDLVVLAVPYQGHGDLVASLGPQLAGKVLVSCVNPLGFDTQGPYGLPVPDGSAAEEAQRIVPAARVVGAFHHVSAANLLRADHDLSGEDVLVCGDDLPAKRLVIALAGAVTGRRGIDAGPLRLARHLEPLTAVLICVNKRYRVRSGIRISGVDAA